jgi:hypothetical protein
MMEAKPASDRCSCFNKNETGKSQVHVSSVIHKCRKSLYFASSLSTDKNLMMFVRSLLSVSFVVLPLTLLSAVLAFHFSTTLSVGLTNTIFYSTV